MKAAMMGELLALASAVCFGTTDFLSGLASRRVNGLTVALYGQLSGTALSVLVALLAGPSTLDSSALMWGALSGLGTGVGVGFLFRATGKGALSVVVPLSDVGAVALPVAVGLAFLGERPSALALTGMVAALPAIWLVSRGDGARARGGLADALVAGAGFAVQFLAMARIPAEAGLWPVVVSRVSSVLLLAALVAATGAPWTFRRPGPVFASGAIGTAAILCYLFATQQQLMSIATVLAALFPAIPVVLGLIVLSERVNRRQVTGLVCAGAAIALIALR
ncbi:EamA family transporter [Amycolatopsis anabasis]|uniref:EamA family transporter n=1 Tax=Amycolatopsis anabasis TaxID=1840409 RepID=UPI001FE6F535|nr:EamA family transporter [Amycolatopsis anabasis]